MFMTEKKYHKIKLKPREFMYLQNVDSLSDSLKEVINNARLDRGTNYSLTVTREQAEQFREIFSDRLSMHGFNKEYEVNASGALLEELIDRFFK